MINDILLREGIIKKDEDTSAKETENKKKKNNRPKRVDHYIADADGNEISFLETIKDPALGTEELADSRMMYGDELGEDEIENRRKFKAFMSQVIPCVINVREHRGKKEQYYRSFATEFYISSCKEGLHTKYGMNENEAFYVMDLDFADFTLTEKSRSFAEFETVPCKRYKDIGVSGKNFAVGEIKTPFKNCVYTAYMGVSEGNISQKKKEFHDDIGMMVSAEEQVW